MSILDILEYGLHQPFALALQKKNAFNFKWATNYRIPGLTGPEMLLCKFPSQCCLGLRCWKSRKICNVCYWHLGEPISDFVDILSSLVSKIHINIEYRAAFHIGIQFVCTMNMYVGLAKNYFGGAHCWFSIRVVRFPGNFFRTDMTLSKFRIIISRRLSMIKILNIYHVWSVNIGNINCHIHTKIDFISTFHIRGLMDNIRCFTK